jgi:hypothetical protein
MDKLWVCSKRVQRVEIRIGRLNTRTVMERACGDQNIRGGNCYPLGACATRQIERRCPHIIINLQFGKCSFQISKYRTLTLGLCRTYSELGRAYRPAARLSGGAQEEMHRARDASDH